MKLHTILASSWEALREELKEETMDTAQEAEMIADEIERTRVQAENLKLLAEALHGYECHSCGERHSHVVEMVHPYDPESRGEYCSNCIIEKRKDGWRVI